MCELNQKVVGAVKNTKLRASQEVDPAAFLDICLNDRPATVSRF